jgi:hypothetical protein
MELACEMFVVGDREKGRVGEGRREGRREGRWERRKE